MKIIKISPNESGAFPPIQEGSFLEPPEGCAQVPDEFDLEPFYANCGFVALDIQDGIVTGMSPNTEALAAWQAQHPPADPAAELAAEVRAQRDKLLAETDWTQVLDAPIDAASREEYRTYRQALRDVPEQAGFLESVVWPELPAAVKAAPDPVDAAFDELIGGGEDA